SCESGLRSSTKGQKAVVAAEAAFLETDAAHLARLTGRVWLLRA
ncbi:hypothetical protein A2U01_0026751, partial [Trifolium medium]|nr:hypothetical protein [Trifolium medium]